MKLLIDTNIFLEILLEQDKADEARELLSQIEKFEFYISDYSLHSIGLILFKRKQYEEFLRFLRDVLLEAGIKVIALTPQDMESMVQIAKQFGLDFDDAYQYVTAKLYGLTIVSFDSDFDRTDIGRKTPKELLEGI